MSTLAFPYPVMSEGPSLAFLSGVRDGEPVPAEVFNADRRVVYLQKMADADWRELELHFDSVLPVGGDVEAGRVAVMVECRATEFRQETEVAAGSAFSVRVQRDDCFGSVTIALRATLAVDDVAGRPVGWSEPWTVYLDEVPRPEAASPIGIQWIDFASPDDDPDGIFSKNKDLLFLVRTDLDQPTLFLNRSIPRLHEFVERASGVDGAPRAVSDALRSSIVSQTWSTLMFDTLNHVEVDEDGEARWPSDAWREQVARALLKALGRPVDTTALAGLHEEWRDSDASVSVVREVQIAAERWSKMPDLVKAALGKLDVDLSEGEVGQ